MDKIFEEEQKHLRETYHRIVEIEADLTRRLETNKDAAAKDIGDMHEDLSLDFDSDAMAMETVIDMHSLNSIVDGYNRTHAIATEKLNRARLLLQQPYFAKVRLKFDSGKPARDIYLGRAGMDDDETRHHFIVDWRSPIAEVYYNQSNGRTSYVANGRTIHCELELRRQFDIERDVLHACFDTTVAIEDPLLLNALSRQHSDKLRDITVTIQREQNEVVRHADVPALLVNGIAGSGKTSVMLQRIAYLLYQERETLTAEQVCLFTPTSLFESYIDSVLPDMGESNPQILTWRRFIEEQGLASRGFGRDTQAESLRRLEMAMETAQLDADDFRSIDINGRSLINLTQVKNTVLKYAKRLTGQRLGGVVADELHEKLERNLKNLANSETLWDEMQSLDLQEQMKIFGRSIEFDEGGNEEATHLAQEYVEYRYAAAHDLVDNGAWLRVDRLGMRLLGKESLSSVEALYLKLLVCDCGEREMRYVMIDEVQDYTEAQLMVLARYFHKAHFLLLGDQNQAIKRGTATFSQIHEVFAASHGQVEEFRLLTSYRSASEVTELFSRLLDDAQRVQTSSVYREGTEPVIEAYAEEDAYHTALENVVDDASDKPGISAIVAADRRQVKAFAELLGDKVAVMDEDDALPSQGMVLLELQQAKGLEFDRVIIPDADAGHYPDEPLARRRLYTAISRATQTVVILANGHLTPLLTNTPTK